MKRLKSAVVFRKVSILCVVVFLFVYYTSIVSNYRIILYTLNVLLHLNWIQLILLISI